MPLHRQRREKKSATKTAGGEKHRLARARVFEPFSKGRGADSKKCNRDAEDPGELGKTPVTRRGMSDPDGLTERNLKHAKGVDLSDRKMNRKRRGRDEPAAITWSRNRAFFVKE